MRNSFGIHKGYRPEFGIFKYVSPYIIDAYSGAAAAYSLRSLSANTTNVVRVRRSADNAEADFTATEITDGTMTAWVNADMPLPLDTATAAAAYSLRNLKTSYTGSVIKVRRSSDNAEADFTADEITDGTMLNWVNTDVQVMTNPDITSATGWTIGLNTTYNASTEAFDLLNENGNTVRQGKAIAGLTYDITLVIDSFSSGGIRVYVGGTQSAVISSAGTYNLTITAGSSNTILGLNPAPTASCSISSFYATQTTSNGFVTTWYDQSGNTNDATQTTAASQPKIVDAGVLVEENGKPALDFDGVDDYLGRVFSLDVTLGYTNFYVCSVNNDATKYILASVKNSSNRYAIGVNSSGDFQSTKRTAGIVGDAATYVSGQVLLSDNSTPEIYLDGNLGAASVATLNNAFSSEFMSIGKNSVPASSGQINGVFQEIILFNSDQSDNRTGIETNINDYYSIYAQDRDGFVTTWYDQSGKSRHGIQNDINHQPLIVSLGLLNKVNNKPSLLFSNAFLVVSNDITGEDFGVYTVIKPNVTDPPLDGWIIDNFTSFGRGLFHDDFFSGRVTLITDTASTTPIRVRSDINTDLNLITGIIDNESPLGGEVIIYRNGIEKDRFDGDVPYQENTFPQYIGAGNSTPSETFEGNISELIIYTGTDLVISDRTAIEANINDYYNIYP